MAPAAAARSCPAQKAWQEVTSTSTGYKVTPGEESLELKSGASAIVDAHDGTSWYPCPPTHRGRVQNQHQTVRRSSSEKASSLAGRSGAFFPYYLQLCSPLVGARFFSSLEDRRITIGLPRKHASHIPHTLDTPDTLHLFVLHPNGTVGVVTGLFLGRVSLDIPCSCSLVQSFQADPCPGLCSIDWPGTKSPTNLIWGIGAPL